jgi:hypothetical protein
MEQFELTSRCILYYPNNFDKRILSELMSPLACVQNQLHYGCGVQMLYGSPAHNLH